MKLSRIEEQRLVRQLRAFGNHNRRSVQYPDSTIYSFKTTGSLQLDRQLEQYVEECFLQEILLDIVVRADIISFLKLEDVEIEDVVQVLDELYRNAVQSVCNIKDNRLLLICLGYNANHQYEIGVYDNGVSFESKERQSNKAYSFCVDLEEQPEVGTTYAKGVRIVFGEQGKSASQNRNI